MLDKLIASPETTSPDRVYRCVVCKAKYCERGRNRLASWGNLVKRVVRSYILISMLSSLVVFFLIPLVMNLSGVLAICIAVCYWKQVRPSIFSVSFSVDP